MCVIGKYPEKLIDLWNKYDSEKNSENDCPSMFGVDQLYIILELAHGGQDLEAYTFQNAIESFSVFLQVIEFFYPLHRLFAIHKSINFSLVV